MDGCARAALDASDKKAVDNRQCVCVCVGLKRFVLTIAVLLYGHCCCL